MKVFWICNNTSYTYKRLKIIFLTYINRSGSTFLANLFSKSPDILVCPEGEVLMNELLVKPESPFILTNENRKRFTQFFIEDPKLKYWGLTEEVLDLLPTGVSNFEIFVSILSNYKNRIKPDATTILFKAERLIHLFDRLVQVKSEYKIYFLSIVRDCRGVYASQKMTVFPDSDKLMSRNPVKTAISWNSHVKKALQMKEVGKLDLVKFEELILSTKEVFFHLLERMEFPFFEICGEEGDLYSRLPESHKKIHSNIVENPIFAITEDWSRTLSVKEQCIIEIIAGKNLTIFGYNFNKQIYPIFTWPLLGYYFLEYLFYKVVNKMQFYRNNSFNN